MVSTLLTMLIVQCLSGLALAGWFDNFSFLEGVLDDTFYSIVESVHLLVANTLVGLVALHLAAILIYKLRKKSLVLAMITGKQGYQASVKPDALEFASNLKALVLFVAALSVTIAIVASL